MKKILFSILIILFALPGCSQDSKSFEILPDFSVSKNEINTRIKLSIPKAWNNFRTRDPISILIENTSSENITFENNFGVKYFIFEQNLWIEIPGIKHYPDEEGQRILEPTENDLSRSVTGVFSPALKNYNKNTTILILLEGEIVKQGNAAGEKTVGYLILNLKP